MATNEIIFDGPNSATNGVFSAEAICIGTESTPMNNPALSINAPSCGKDNCPDKETPSFVLHP